MSNWAKAAEIPGLIPAAMRSPGSAPASAQEARPTYVQQTGPVAHGAVAHGTADGLDPGEQFHLAFDPQRTFDRVWPLYWRVIVLALSQIVVIPFPWMAASFLRWFVAHIELPDQQRVAFAGKAEDIWYILIPYALCAWVSLALSFVLTPLASWLLVPLTTFFALIMTRWFYANLVWEGRSAALQFTGGYWPLLGWTLLAAVSVISIVGWAWVYVAWARWMCRNVRGSNRHFIFTGTGWGYLWRTITFVLLSYFMLPMPWALRWYVRWLVSRFALVQA